MRIGVSAGVVTGLNHTHRRVVFFEIPTRVETAAIRDSFNTLEFRFKNAIYITPEVMLSSQKL